MAQVDVQLRRAAKPVSKGPQSYGGSPTLTEIRVLAFDAAPVAKCASAYISATAGTGTGICTPGSSTIVTIDDSSFDSDTQEGDALITSQTTLVRVGRFCASKSWGLKHWGHMCIPHVPWRMGGSHCGVGRKGHSYFCCKIRQKIAQQRLTQPLPSDNVGLAAFRFPYLRRTRGIATPLEPTRAPSPPSPRGS